MPEEVWNEGGKRRLESELRYFETRLSLEQFYTDVRGLAVFRILIGIALFIDLAVRFQVLEKFYTDAGAVPSSLVPQLGFPTAYWTFHTLLGSWGGQAALGLLAAVFYALLLVGRYTRLATIVSFIFLLSAQNRNLLVWQGCDQLLRLMLLWGIFLPLGACWSWDARLKRKRGEAVPVRRMVCTYGTVGTLLQLASVYVFSAVLKSGEEWTREGSAIYYALSLDEFVKPLGRWLLQFPTALQFGTFIVLFLELLIPALFFIPFIQVTLRALAFLLIVTLHAGFGLSMLLGPFPVYNIFFGVILLPPEFWDWVSRKLKLVPRPGPDGNGEEVYVTEKPFSQWSRIRKLAQAVPIALIVFCLTYNLSTVEQYPFQVPDELRDVGKAVGVEQAWNLFAPRPLKDDGWWVLEGELEDKTTVDILRNGGPPDFKKPEYVSLDYRNYKEQKYMRNLYENAPTADQLLRYIDYEVKRWEERNPALKNHLRRAKLYFMKEPTPPPGQPGQVSQELLWQVSYVRAFKKGKEGVREYVMPKDSGR